MPKFVYLLILVYCLDPIGMIELADLRKQHTVTRNTNILISLITIITNTNLGTIYKLKIVESLMYTTTNSLLYC